MWRRFGFLAGLISGTVAVAGFVSWAHGSTTTTIVCPVSAPFALKLAAKEIRRYFYLRTGRLAEIASGKRTGDLVAVATKDSPGDSDLVGNVPVREKANISGLAAEQYLIKSTERNDGGCAVLIIGGDPIGALYGAYRFAELLGVRFYLHGDVVPDDPIPPELPKVDEVGRPLFALRGIQPFHDFPEGPDWWNLDDYKAIIGQLPKLRMNFIGLHTYPQGRVGPEPAVWIGRREDVGPDGKVKASYPARHFTASNVTGAWDYRPGNTSEYYFGADQLFDRDDYGADYMRDTFPWDKMPPEQCNALFDRMGGVLHDALTYAHTLGVKTCIGTETPLTIPDAVKERLRAAGKNPGDPAVVQELYQGMFQRIAKTYPVDWYWLWTPEGWRGRVSEAQINATQADFRAAIAAVEKVKPGFTLATCGWRLGPLQNPSLFDSVLPKNMAMACISGNCGGSPVEPDFRRVQGRPKWSIPWLEDDPGLTMPQLWVGRMRRDAADSLAYGCTGLMGIHWRTRVLGPNVAALAQAAWDQKGWNPEYKPDAQASRMVGQRRRVGQGSAATAGPPTAGPPTVAAGGPALARSSLVPPYEPPHYLPCRDFYEDWAKAEFGPEASKQIAAIFTRLDGRLPRPAGWFKGPGNIQPDNRPWEAVRRAYAFVDELAALAPKTRGAGHSRFNYWLAQFRYLRSMAEVRCIWSRYNATLAKVKSGASSEDRKRLARELALPVRKQLVAALAEMHRHLFLALSTPGELGTVCNWQQQILPGLLIAPGKELAALLGEPLPADAEPSKEYTGSPHVFMPTCRTAIAAGETFKVTVIAAGIRPKAAFLFWRPLGKGAFRKVALVHVARGVYNAIMPQQATRADFEYYIRVFKAGESDGAAVSAETAAMQTQTVVTYDE